MIKIFKYLKKIDLLYLFFAICLIVFQVFLDLTMPDYTAKLTTTIYSESLIMGEILKNGGMMLLCALGSLVSAISVGYFSSHIAANFAKTLRENLFNKISEFSDKEINYFSTASLITRTTNDVVQMQGLIAMGMQMIIKAPILAVWAMFKISNTSIEWTMATVITIGVIIITILIVMLTAYPKFKRIQKLTDKMNGVTRENIEGVRVIRAFNAENYQEEKFAKVNKEVTKTNLFTSRMTGVLSPIMSLGMNILVLAIYWIGASLINNADVKDKAVLLGNMTSFSQYALQIVMAFMMLVMIFIILPRAAVSTKRINEVLDTDISIKFDSQSDNSDLKGEIEFKNVNFSYSSDDNYCLENISFKIEKGQTFAIIGATGAGKTSLINLIPRFYDATSGEVLLNGVNIKKYSKKDIENKISIATQKAILFKGDIKSNVIYGCKDEISDEDENLLKALKIAQANFVLDTENGIHMHVAQNGTNLSGGQKQRVSIARAIFKKAEVVIFDDTFSALDYKTDMLVRKEIKNNLKDTTVIIVAQRIGTIKNADQILVLDDGKIAGIGKHEDLLNNCRIYKEIALSQLNEEEL